MLTDREDEARDKPKMVCVPVRTHTLPSHAVGTGWACGAREVFRYNKS